MSVTLEENRPERGIITAAILLSVASLFGFVWLTTAIADAGTVRADEVLLQRVYQLSTSSDGVWLTPAVRVLAWMGNWQALVPLGLFLVYLALSGRATWRPFLFYAVGCAGAGTLVLLGKFLVARPRPAVVTPLEETVFASYPSGHALYTVFAYGFLAYLVARNPRVPVWMHWVAALGAFVLILLSGLGRIYLASHFPTDVIGGMLLGIPWLVLVVLAYEEWVSWPRRPPGQPGVQ